MSDPSQRGKVIGIGGIFFKSKDPKQLKDWYETALGIENKPHVGGMFHWREHGNPDREQVTVWSVFPETTKHFDGELMINYIVDDLDALLAKLEAQGVRIDPDRQNADYGKFAWIYDPEGQKVELWEPASK